MYYIAICDDEECTCTVIEACVMKYSQKNNIAVHIDVFYSGEEFQKALIKQSYYDIVFLDIELNTTTGIDIANSIRNEMDNEAMQIIYISSKQQYAMALFKTRPMDFLIKPLSTEAIIEDFIQAIKIVSRENQFFEFHVGHNMLKKAYKDILYFQSNNRKITLVSSDETKEFYGKMNVVQSQLRSSDFLRVHKSYLVNAIHVIEYSYEWLKTKDEAIIPISKSYRTEIRQKLLSKRGQKHHEYRICN